MGATDSTLVWNDIVSTTLNNTRSIRYDQIFRRNPFWAFLHMQGRKELVDGGIKIQRAVEYATNGTVRSYEGYDPIDLTPQEALTSLTDELREVAGSIVISRREERQNSGRAQIISLIEQKIANLDRSFSQKLSEMLLDPTGASMTAGNSGKDLNPLTVVVSKSANTVHNIAESTNSWWAPKRKTSGSANAGTLDYTEFKGELRNFYNTCSKHEGSRPNFILTSQEVHEKYEESLEGQVRYGSTEMANLGFDTVMLRGAQVAWDEICPRQANNNGDVVAHDSGSIDEHIAYFLNTDFLKLYVDSQTDLVNRPFMDSVDQTAKSALVLFMGQLICTNRRTQGFFGAIQPLNIAAGG
jgi:hypothetical protein